MFALYEKLETEVEIAGKLYPVNMAFDNVMRFLNVTTDMTLQEGARVYYGIYTLLGVELDLEMEQLEVVFRSLVSHFIQSDQDREVEVDLEGNVMPVAKQRSVYDLNHDAPYIYASFMQAYGIDLLEEQGKLDWRKFQSLLMSLPDDTKFKQIISIRLRPYPKGKGMIEERKRLKELKKQYALPGDSIEE